MHTQAKVDAVGGGPGEEPRAHTFYAANNIKILRIVVLDFCKGQKISRQGALVFLAEDTVRSVEKRVNLSLHYLKYSRKWSEESRGAC